jgi:hypothetical protein
MGRLFVFVFFNFLIIEKSFSQNSANQVGSYNGNTISTAVPFLLISPDSRGSSLGDAGVSTEPDLFSAHWNPGKLSQMKGDYGIGVGYVPWLKNIDPNIYLASVSGFKKIDHRTSLGFSVYYFNLGQTTFKDESGYQNGVGYPNEFSLDATFSKKIGMYSSLGLNGKYIHSDLTNGQIYQGAELKPGNSLALDVGYFYSRFFEMRNPNHIGFGITISNIGPKISYDFNTNSFLPTNLRLGLSVGKTFNEVNYTNFSLEFNKLLVPTLPITDSNGKIISGRDPNRSLLSGILGSFSDAPGGIKEELQEISISPGFEYVYDNLISLRTGFYLENKNFGNRKYINFGIGLKIQSYLDLSLSYLETLVATSTVNNSLRITLSAEL